MGKREAHPPVLFPVLFRLRFILSLLLDYLLTARVMFRKGHAVSRRLWPPSTSVS
jgi:hypothetical protein